MQVSGRVGVGPRRAIAFLVAAAVLLSIGFVVAPAPFAGGGYGTFYDNSPLVDSLGVNFADYRRAGTGIPSPGLQDIIDYWSRYHVVKALLATLLLGVLIALGIQLWGKFRDARTTTSLVAGGVAVTILAVVALILVIANIQGALAPFASLLPLVPAVQLDEVGRAFADAGASSHDPVLAAIESDFVRYHAILAGIAAVATVALIAANVLFWRLFANAADSRIRRASAAFGISGALLALGLLVVIAANVSTAMAPSEPLRNFFGVT
ncbi:hypothetical protein [Antrihabitans sp. YC2-6]|uniref:hypothetical protein n=1 Tax=Antrihabitans sp. YC2-6 TaxID=2799498 RepID=UPI0018F3CA2D|nr:hypothetical protein [Antrihabitans sp. YC2-6]MBJ8345811.1 hypothetical protein [Antrihabitans sp. YC2-6]